jgi:3-oxoacyl-[acyl-carrier-protein] synthase I
MPEPVVIVGASALTAVGLSVAETAASFRARTMRFQEIAALDQHFDPVTAAAVTDDGLMTIPPLTEEGLRTALTERLMSLAVTGVAQALKPLGDDARNVPIAVALPRSGDSRDNAAFLDKLVALAPALSARGSAVFDGRAGGLAAIGHAASLVSSGQAAYALGGGVDSLLDPYALSTLDRDRRLKSETHMDGCIPGEAAAFVLVSTRSAAARDGRPVLAAISDVATGLEPGYIGSSEPYRGEGLATALNALFALASAHRPVEEVFTSMNGESYWAKEWGVAFLRNKAAFAPDRAIHHVADTVGDVGAACGPLSVALAAGGLAARSRKSPCLVYSSSDDGARAALTVAAA